MILLIHGPEELLRSERLAALRAALGPAEMAELSTTWLDGRKVSVAEVRHHADAMPFLTAKRLVVVEGLVAQINKRAQAGGKAKRKPSDDQRRNEQGIDELLLCLDQAPETTDLALVEAETLGKRDRVHKRVEELASQGRGEIVACEAPEQKDLPAWVIQRARAKGAEIEGAAAFDMAAFIGRNLRLIDSELEKLVAYRAGEGPIRRDDVRLLVPYAQEANIFDMVDALGRQDGAAAVRLLRELERDGAAPLYLLAMITRQFRILIQVGDEMARNPGADKYAIGKAIGLHHFPTSKAMTQSRRWRMADLEAVYDRLLETDLAIKTGKMPDDMALDLLVVELSQR